MNCFVFLGVFVARSKDDDMLLTKNMVVGESVYGEKRISVDVRRVTFSKNYLDEIIIALSRGEIKKKLNTVFGILSARN